MLDGIPEEALHEETKIRTKKDVLQLLEEMLKNDNTLGDYIHITRKEKSITITADVNGQFTSYDLMN
tara:strand:- start:361 stop:561 length:201 start_codon:yes stop_codon:yes gene_type:complete